MLKEIFKNLLLRSHKGDEAETLQEAYLVTLDVSLLYTNIPHEDGIEACRYFLENNGHSGSLSVDNVCARY